MTGALDPLRRLGAALSSPRTALDEALREPRPWATALALGLVLAVLGAATLPRQLDLLAGAFPLLGDPSVDAVARLMRRGLTRLIVADRLVPAPTLALAVLLTAVAAEPVLVLPRERRRAIWGVLLLALAPLVVARVGELAMTWLVHRGATLPPGEIVQLPHRFRTGPALLWPAGASLPRWLEVLDGSLNLVTAWGVTLLALGLRRLDGAPRVATWHVALPLACLAAGTLAVWVLAPAVLVLVLGTP